MAEREHADTLIPVLPCNSLGETLKFYRALGFEVTREQTTPYVWGEVVRGSFTIDFQRVKVDPEKNYTLCVLSVEEVETLYREFVAGLKREYERVPFGGFPRISRVRRGGTRLMAIDPAGNQILFISRSEPEADYNVDEAAYGALSPMAKALDTAVWLRDLKGHDDTAAARVLDKALAKNDPSPAIDIARVLAARAELAVALGEEERYWELRDALAGVELSEVEREQYRDELEAAEELKRLLESD